MKNLKFYRGNIYSEVVDHCDSNKSLVLTNPNRVLFEVHPGYFTDVSIIRNYQILTDFVRYNLDVLQLSHLVLPGDKEAKKRSPYSTDDFSMVSDLQPIDKLPLSVGLRKRMLLKELDGMIEKNKY